MGAIERVEQGRQAAIRHVVAGTPGRREAEEYVAGIFQRHYGAAVRSFAPNLMLLVREERILAAAGWRGASDETLFLESYLDVPIEKALGRVARREVGRELIVEVGHLAADQRGGAISMIRHLATHLHRLGYEWAVFTATRELIEIFARLSLPPLALAPADAHCLGEQAGEWGSYYAAGPVVVAGLIRLALDRTQRRG